MRVILLMILLSTIYIVIDSKYEISKNEVVNYHVKVPVKKVYICNDEICVFDNGENRRLTSFGSTIGDVVYKICHVNLTTAMYHCWDGHESVLPEEYALEGDYEMKDLVKKWNEMGYMQKVYGFDKNGEVILNEVL